MCQGPPADNGRGSVRRHGPGLRVDRWTFAALTIVYAGGCSDRVAMPDDFIAPGTKTRCVKGEPIAFGSTQESGSVAPNIPDVVTRSPTRVPPLSGGTLLALADGRTLVASDPERDRVDLVDAQAFTLRSSVELALGDEPGRLAEDGAGRIHVVLRGKGAIATVDAKTGMITRRSVCPAPRGIAYDSQTDRIHVACAGGELVSLSSAGGDALRTVTLDRDLRDVVVGPGGTLLVSTFRKADVLVVNRDGRVMSRLTPSAGPAPTVAGGTTRRTPSVAWRMVARQASSGGVVMLHQTGTLETVDTAPGGYSAVGGCDGIVRAGLSVLTPSGPSPPIATGLDDVTLAVDVALSPDGQKVALAVAGNNPAQGPTVVQMSAVAAIPSVPLACRPAPNELSTMPEGQVVAVAYGRSGVLFAQTREPATVWRSDTLGAVALATDSREDTGHFLFHANSGGGLACASCHPEGGEDGRVWNLVCVGGRRTQSLRGGLRGSEPFHWDGHEADFSALADDVFSGRMAGPPLSDDQKDALFGWIESIPALPSPTGLDPLAVARGKLLFDDAQIGCSTCHVGPRFSDNATVDVGTGRPYQVPTLTGLIWRAPFMHDGCAAAIRDRFGAASCSGGDRHGRTSSLSDRQLSDLTAFLTSL